MCRIKIPLQDFALKMQGGWGLMCKGGAYLQELIRYKNDVCIKVRTYYEAVCHVCTKTDSI